MSKSDHSIYLAKLPYFRVIITRMAVSEEEIAFYWEYVNTRQLGRINALSCGILAGDFTSTAKEK
jgi:hypothetical protein